MRRPGATLAAKSWSPICLALTLTPPSRSNTKNHHQGKGFVSGFEAFQTSDELEQKSFRLTAPAGVKIAKRVSGPADTVKEEQKTGDGRQTFQWSAGNVKAMPAEPQLPPEWVFLAGVSYFAGDPKAYLSELHQTMVRAVRTSARRWQSWPRAREAGEDAAGRGKRRFAISSEIDPRGRPLVHRVAAA